MSRASVSRGNNSNCFHGKQFWPSLAHISLVDSKSVRRVARVTTRFREPRGTLVAPSLRSGRYSPGPLGSLKRVVTRAPRLTYICDQLPSPPQIDTLNRTLTILTTLTHNVQHIPA